MNPRCWFGHADRLRERDEDGRLMFACTRCGHAIHALATKHVVGPAHQLKHDRGARTTKAKVQRQDNVREWRVDVERQVAK